MNAYDKAIQLLKIRPHASGELKRKLTLKGFNAEEASEVTAKLTEQGLLNDAEFAAIFLDSLIRFKTFGYFMLKVKLLQRGIPRDDAESLLAVNFPPEIELEVARRAVAKEKNLDRLKLMQKLSRKGFRTEAIRAALER